MSIKERIEAATIADALLWQGSQEQYLFCIDYLNISAHRLNSDCLVWTLETRFEKLLNEEEQHALQ